MVQWLGLLVFLMYPLQVYAKRPALKFKENNIDTVEWIMYKCYKSQRVKQSLRLSGYHSMLRIWNLSIRISILEPLLRQRVRDSTIYHHESAEIH
jgi:hypothetical protein